MIAAAWLWRPSAVCGRQLACRPSLLVRQRGAASEASRTPDKSPRTGARQQIRVRNTNGSARKRHGSVPTHGAAAQQSDAQQTPRLMQYVGSADAIDAQTRLAVLQSFRSSLKEEDTKTYLRQLVDIYGDAVTQPNVPLAAQQHDTKQLAAGAGAGAGADGAENSGSRVRSSKRNESSRAILDELEVLSQQETVHWRTLWDKYNQLPEPRMLQLPRVVLRDMLHRMGTQDPDDAAHRTGELSEAYSALMEEMTQCKIHIWRRDWNTAMHLFLSSHSVITGAVLDKVMETFHRMENEFRCPADIVTFTILYLAAAKASRFGLADTLWRQRHARGLAMDRDARIAVIIASGLRRNRHAVTNAYVSLVEDGHAVDMGVLNTVAKAFVDAGAIGAAEELLRRIRCIRQQAGVDKLAAALRDWREQRRVNKLLRRAPTLSAEAQFHLQAILHSHMTLSEASFVPLVRWYAYAPVPDQSRLLALLGEMAEAGLPVSPATFVMLFQGIRRHAATGGPTQQRWSPEVMRAVTHLFRRQVALDQRFVHMEAKLPLAAVEACHVLGMLKEARSCWRAATWQWTPPAWLVARVEALIGHETVAERLAAENDGKLEQLFATKTTDS